VRLPEPLDPLATSGRDDRIAVAIDAALIRLAHPLLAGHVSPIAPHGVRVVAAHARERLDLRGVDAPLVLLGDLLEVVVALDACRRRSTESVRELVERLVVRALVANRAVEAGVDAALPTVHLEDEDPVVGDGLGRLHVALDARLGPGWAGCQAPGHELESDEHGERGSHGRTSHSSCGRLPRDSTVRTFLWQGRHLV